LLSYLFDDGREQRATVREVASATAEVPAAATSRETCPHGGHQPSLDLKKPTS
jgi:hypothetical protein